MAGTVAEGTLLPGLPYLRVGSGPPLVVATGLSSQHANPRGMERRLYLSWVSLVAEHFTVYVVNRKAGLAPGATMADIAADYASAIGSEIGGPVLLQGVSTGGAVALQLAIDHPQLVQRLVLAPGACRLSERGRSAQEELARLVREGAPRRGWANVMELSFPPGVRAYAGRHMGRLLGAPSEDPSDLLATIAAEDACDTEGDLHRVQAPTLVLGGTADQFYSEDLFRRTAAGIPGARLVLFRGKGHAYVAANKVPAAVALGFLLAS